MEQQYTVDYFIEKFSAIPEENWAVIGGFTNEMGQCTARGHCGENWGIETPESDALWDIFADTPFCVQDINNNLVRQYPQPTPKQRVLAALQDIKTLMVA